MASAEMLKGTHTVDGGVIGVDDRVQSVDRIRLINDDVKGVMGPGLDVGQKVQIVDDRLDRVNRSISLYSPLHILDLFIGNQPRDQLLPRLLRWLLPSDPSTNHNVTRKAHFDGTAQWFIQGSIFDQWKSTGSLLWIRGKRMLLWTFTMR